MYFVHYKGFNAVNHLDSKNVKIAAVYLYWGPEFLNNFGIRIPNIFFKFELFIWSHRYHKRNYFITLPFFTLNCSVMMNNFNTKIMQRMTRDGATLHHIISMNWSRTPPIVIPWITQFMLVDSVHRASPLFL